MSGLTLRLREIASALPTNDESGAIAPGAPEGADNAWLDSTLDLERGLEVMELPLETGDATLVTGLVG